MKYSLYLGGVYSWVCKHPPPNATLFCRPLLPTPSQHTHPTSLMPSQSDLMVGGSPRTASISKALKTLHLSQLTCALYLS